MIVFTFVQRRTIYGTFCYDQSVIIYLFINHLRALAIKFQKTVKTKQTKKTV